MLPNEDYELLARDVSRVFSKHNERAADFAPERMRCSYNNHFRH
jgi:hypothetical protein